MTDWRAITDSGSTTDELKRQVHLAAVCIAHGVDIEQVDTNRWVGRCPFHDDSNPSFAVWYDTSWRAGCWSCSFTGGDIFDVLQQLNGSSFKEAFQEAKRLAEEMPDDVLDRATAQEDEDIDFNERFNSFQCDIELLREFLATKHIVAPAEWVRDQFHVRTFLDGTIVVPHFDKDRVCVGMKLRRPGGWKPKSVGGTKLREMYGVWRDQKHSRIIMTEGESDTWTLAYEYRDDKVDVFGLPSGAHARPKPEWIESFGDRYTTLLFDADSAGRDAAKQWATSLGSCDVARLFEGEDATSVGGARAREAIDAAFKYGHEAPSTITRMPNGMARMLPNGEQSPMIDGVLDVVRVIDVRGDDIIYDVMINDDENNTHFASVRDLGSSDAIRVWLNKHGRTWHGRTPDAQELVRTFNMESAFVTRQRGVQQVGFVEGADAFVLPDETLGNKGYVYVPPLADTRLGEKTSFVEAEYDSDVLNIITGLHAPDVVTPLLAWIAASFFRSDFDSFPVLAVLGGSGWGKTTLVESTLRVFGVKRSVVLTSSTPHAVSSFASATTSVPIWFDEYRFGMRKDAKMTFDQVLRDAWDRGASVKGGQTENKSELTYFPATAPVIVSGEDAFRETSHVERMAIIGIPREGRDPKALKALHASRIDGFARAYTKWCVDARKQGWIKQPPRVLDRMKHTIAVLEWGWDTINAFSEMTNGMRLVAPDFSRVKSAQEESSKSNVIVDALSLMIDRIDRSTGTPLVWIDDDDVCVRVVDFVKEAKLLDVPLPGNATSVRRWLDEQFPGVTTERDGWGVHARIPGARRAILDV